MNTKPLLALGAVMFAMVPPARSIELKQTTLEAWNEFVHSATDRSITPSDADQTFLWIDRDPDRKLRIQNGGVVVAPTAGHGIEKAPDGLIHDWIGGVFIPGATVQDLLAVIDDYDGYKRIYKPVVMDSKSLQSNAEDQEFSMTWKRHVMFVTAAMEADYRVHDVALDSHHGYSVVDATQIRQIENFGRATERVLPPDTGSGFIWRIRTIAKYEERDGGLYFQIEAMALTRDIPSSVQWLVAPVVNRLSIDSLATTLKETKQAVMRHSAIEHEEHLQFGGGEN